MYIVCNYAVSMAGSINEGRLSLVASPPDPTAVSVPPSPSSLDSTLFFLSPGVDVLATLILWGALLLRD